MRWLFADWYKHINCNHQGSEDQGQDKILNRILNDRVAFWFPMIYLPSNHQGFICSNEIHSTQHIGHHLSNK